ncbi:MAG: hypothetical protein Q8L76_13940 [Cypionkella sp.]|uniref:hypothetical protein n=1 Tax=Cypionkella sp. TaxID=2811411 RepID=UPI00272EF859|nr:hypothetical protein [Cypionkella sp.]MDP1577834.1 hypothetical protein [Cypionkella sp.]MDP2051932.1 hypothetical protein [Cypionkella sp.]
MQEIITNAVTGVVTVRDFTPEEIAAHTPDPSITLAAWRETAHCSRMQGILAIGETRWATVLEYRDQVATETQPATTWAEVIVIDDARDWYRNSETIALFGWLLNLTDTEIDALFVAAAAITA